MNLYVIGNGFDKAHLLKTDYIDFRDYLYETHPDFLSAFEDTYGNCLESRRDLVYESLWKTFEGNLCEVAEDFIVESATSLHLGLEGGDIDIEDTMMEYLEAQYSFIDRLQDYLYEWITRLDIDIAAKTTYIHPVYDNGDDITEDLFLTFNYTLVLENVYKINPENICHIHNSISNKQEKLLIGHGNYDKKFEARAQMHIAQERYEDKKSAVYSTLANYYEKTEKNPNYHIDNNRFFFNRVADARQIFVVGHSFGEVDMPYFEEIKKRVSPTTQWNIVSRNEQEVIEKVRSLKKIGVDERMIRVMLSTAFFDA